MFIYNDYDLMIISQKKTHQFIFKISMIGCDREKIKAFYHHLKKKSTLKVVQPFCLGVYEEVFYFQLPTDEFRKIFTQACKTMLLKLGLSYTWDVNKQTITIK